MKKIYIMTEKKLNRLIDDQIRQITESKSRNYEKELLIKQANITALQAQINPHFLYNALECIRAQAVLEDSHEIAKVTQTLSRFFRYNISNSSDLITLKDEFENVNDYILIQQYRFRNRISVENNYDKNDKVLMDVLLPKLVLQPTVENSIIHGLEDMTSGAKITINAERTQNHVTIRISDNGKGMNLQQLEKLKARLINPIEATDRKSDTAKNGIALNNVNRRIQLFFGEEYNLNINSCLGEGTDVEFFIPLQLSKRSSYAK